MPLELTLTSLPESVEEGTLMAWHKQVGEAVAEGEKLADVETDKVVLELPAQAAGVLTEILKQAGETVVQGDVLARLDPEASPSVAAAVEETASGTGPKEEPEPASEPTEAKPAAEAAETRPSEPASGAAPGERSPPAETETPSEERLSRLSPAARKLAHENGLNPEHILGSGRGGRVTKADVLRHLDAQRPAPPEPTRAPPVDSMPLSPAVHEEDAALHPSAARTEGAGKRVPMSRLRARIAERLVEAQQTAAILTTFNEVNMQGVIDLRNRYKEDFEKAHDTRLGFMSFFVKAVVEALKQYPEVNASIEGTDIVYHDYYDIGIAVSAPRGLVVPVLRDAERMTFAEIEKTIRDLGTRAQENKLAIEELTGGTFSITNGGVFGSMLSTPILNPPQSAILGMHAIQDRPVAENGAVVIRPMMYLALSYDHRLIDGREAVSFLVTLRQLLEDPARLMLNL